MINHVSFQGRFTKDVEVLYSPSEKAYTRFTLVWNEKIKDNETICFLNCVAFNSVATNAAKYFKKGKMAVVEGRLITNEYKTKNGEKRSSTELIVGKIHFCDDKPIFNKYEEDDDGMPFE